MTEATTYDTIIYEEDGPIGIIRLNRPENGNMFNAQMIGELRRCIEGIRMETRTRVIVLTGVGDRFFCIGGEHDAVDDTTLYPGVVPTLEMYEAIERLQKPVIAAVNGYAVGGGNVLQVVCDMTVAKRSAIFRQVGPMVGSFDAGYGTWFLEDLVGKKRAKEIWMRNPKMSAEFAERIGLINQVFDDETFWEDAMAFAREIALRGSYALAAVKGSFSARHSGVVGLSRVTHDLMLAPYYRSEEAKELAKAFAEKREPDTDKFGR
ncbi:enoyl-CoA hydratase-related protein [Antarctobacter sp.]|uniref:enoyl-CoA hydratase-related protein n=1 Tax=Antarctobacter sp. TaxID=1872577 RepID=UPI003A91A394